MPQPSSYIRLLVGDEYERNEAMLAYARKTFGQQEFDVLRFNAAERETARAIEELLSYSMLAENRVVVLDHLEKIPKRKDDFEENGSSAKVDLDILLGFLQAPRGDTPFLMLAQEEKGVPAAIRKALPKDALITVQKTSKARIQEAIRRNCEKADVKMAPDALRYFMERCGEDAGAARRELDKILLWAEPGQTVLLEDCRRLIEIDDEERLWEMTDCVARKDAKGALTALHKLLRQGDHPIMLIAILAGQFRMMHSCKCMEKERVPYQERAKRIGETDWKIRKATKSMESFSLNALRSSLSLFHQADQDAKGGKSDEYMVIERLVIDLCRLGADG